MPFLREPDDLILTGQRKKTLEQRQSEMKASQLKLQSSPYYVLIGRRNFEYGHRICNLLARATGYKRLQRLATLTSMIDRMPNA